MALIDYPLEHGGKRLNKPNRIVIHSMAEYIKDPDPVHASEFLRNYKLSAHALVAPNGDLYLLRDDDQRAWHARGFNKNSLGLEFLVEGEHDYGSFIEAIKQPFVTTAQWEAGVEAVRNWLSAYDIEHLDRHSDLSPGRKVDPGAGFHWQDFLTRVGWIAR